MPLGVATRKLSRGRFVELDQPSLMMVQPYSLQMVTCVDEGCGGGRRQLLRVLSYKLRSILSLMFSTNRQAVLTALTLTTSHTITH